MGKVAEDGGVEQGKSHDVGRERDV
jgi:hypothetical protein